MPYSVIARFSNVGGFKRACNVSKCLWTFFLKNVGYVTWLTTRMIKACVHFCNYLVTALLLNGKMHCMTRHIGTCIVMVMGLLYTLNAMVKCVYYMGVGSNGCFVTGVTLIGGHYRTYIISGMGHPRSDSVMSLVLWAVVYNIWGTSVVL